MANKKISALTELTAVAYNDYLAIVDTTAGATKKISMNNLVYSYMVVAGIANLGTGRTDGELKVTADEYGNRYTWDNDNSKWRIHTGNCYATAGLPAAASYTIPDGTIVFDVTTGTTKQWDTSSWTSPTFGAIIATGQSTLPTINLTGGQIAFPATAVPSADPNTLDDYEEGTWTATFGAATSGTITVNTSYDLMSYTKIGRAVSICGNAVVTSVSSPVGVLSLATLPFANQTGAEDSGMAAVALYAQGLEATGTTAMQACINNGDTKITISHFTAGAIGAAAADVKASSQFAVNATYFT